MAFQLVSFPQRSDRNFDWNRDELAELYRIEHALAQANIRLETDRGVSDEGDPWFVFCRADGEVLVHISRYDGQYRLHSPGLANTLVGRSFAELTKSFVSQVPVQVAFQHREGAKLFVHPAAMLAVIVGTLFAASNDLHLFSARSEPGQHTDDGYDRGSLKHTLQATVASYIDTFLCSLRDNANLQQSSYLGLISAVAAFIIESTVGITDHSPNGLETANIMADGMALAHSASSHEDNAPIVVDDQVSKHKVAVNENSAEITTAETAAQQNAVNEEKASAAQEIVAANGSQLATNHVTENSLPAVGPIENVMNVNDLTTEDNVGHLARPTTLEPILTNLSSSNIGLYASNITHSGAGSDLAQTSPQTNSFSDISGLLAQALNSPNENLQINAIFLNIGHVTTDLATVTAAANTVASSLSSGSAAPQIPIFDTAAENTLIAFFKANPNVETVFYNGNIIVSDGIQSVTDQVIVKIWEVGTSGETIAIVGHADHGLTA